MHICHRIAFYRRIGDPISAWRRHGIVVFAGSGQPPIIKCVSIEFAEFLLNEQLAGKIPKEVEIIKEGTD